MNQSTGRSKTAKPSIAWKNRLAVIMISLITVGVGLVFTADYYVQKKTEKHIFDTLGNLVTGELSADGMCVLRAGDDENCLPQAEVILVLGCSVYADGTPSSMLRARLDQAVALYQAGAAKKILMSGDHGQNDYDEVNAMKAYAIGLGVPAEDIFMDHAGFSTYDSMWRAANVFGIKSCIIVSQRYHLARAVFLAEKMQLQAYGVSSDFSRYQRQDYYDIREMLARSEAILQTIRKKPAVYQGEQFDIHGDGNVTNDKQ